MVFRVFCARSCACVTASIPDSDRRSRYTLAVILIIKTGDSIEILSKNEADVVQFISARKDQR